MKSIESITRINVSIPFQQEFEQNKREMAHRFMRKQLF